MQSFTHLTSYTLITLLWGERCLLQKLPHVGVRYKKKGTHFLLHTRAREGCVFSCYLTTKNKPPNPPTQQQKVNLGEPLPAAFRAVKAGFTVRHQEHRHLDRLEAPDRECGADSTVGLMPCSHSDPPRSPRDSSKHALPAESKCCTETVQAGSHSSCIL